MRRLRNGKYTGISTKLFVLVFLSVVGLFFVIGLFGYQRLFNPIKQNNEAVLQDSVVQVENYLKTFMNNILGLLLLLSNPVINDSLGKEDIDRLLETMMTQHSEEFEAIFLIEGEAISSSSPFSYQFFVTEKQVADIVRQMSGDSGVWWSPPYQSGGRQSLSVAKRIDAKRIIVFDLNLSSLTGPSVVQNKEKAVFLFTGPGQPIAFNMPLTSLAAIKEYESIVSQLQSLTAASQTSYDRVHTETSAYKVLRSDQNRWNWVVFSIVKESEAYPLLALLEQQMVVVLLVAVILAAFLSMWIARYIQVPVGAITQQMKAGARGALDARVSFKRNDEFAYIADAFNRMMDSIQTLFDDLRLVEEKKRQLELKALQSQIHPHFLHNTLSAIYCLDQAGRAAEMAEMLCALTGLLQYSTDKKGDIVTVEEELHQLEQYDVLMKLRYGDVFRLDLVVRDESLIAPIPKLTLITLVENSIFYGLGTGETNHIIVAGMAFGEGATMLEVSDTGPGIEPSKLKCLLAGVTSLGRHKGLNNLGLRNIHERIRLHFGESYGLSFPKEAEEGLLVCVRLPEPDGPEAFRIKGEGGEKHAEAVAGGRRAVGKGALFAAD
ncbi:sensor histidine kinase [Paenibacillus phytorum]|uniref:sensor histidine kinase n=1 Tax=Paenibacillus phytorum TaxID=2654977 RepID=UPI001492254F|nr:histidine kinase [Paenibacillus phytorum]